MQLIPEVLPTLLLAIPFFVSFFALRFILLGPLQQYMDDRDEMSSKALTEANEYVEKAKANLDDLTVRLKEARGQVAALHAEARGKAQVQEIEILGKARKAADVEIGAAAAQIGTERDIAAKVLEQSARELAQDITSNVLGAQA
jgi:F0F1-type ATP synthase membrane subunit b/b'